MGLERMNCCGSYTHVYGDAGARRHAPGCDGKVRKREGRRVWSALERLVRLRKEQDG